jgi:hypothetical protein
VEERVETVDPSTVDKEEGAVVVDVVVTGVVAVVDFRRGGGGVADKSRSQGGWAWLSVGRVGRRGWQV